MKISPFKSPVPALIRYLEDMEDTYLAIDRIENLGERISMEDAKKLLEVED